MTQHDFFKEIYKDFCIKHNLPRNKDGSFLSAGDYLFEEEDDAERYAMMLNDDEKNSELNVIEIDDGLAIMTCKRYNYKYAVITPNDIVIPPKNDNISKD